MCIANSDKISTHKSANEYTHTLRKYYLWARMATRYISKYLNNLSQHDKKNV